MSTDIDVGGIVIPAINWLGQNKTHLLTRNSDQSLGITFRCVVAVKLLLMLTEPFLLSLHHIKSFLPANQQGLGYCSYCEDVGKQHVRHKASGSLFAILQ